MLRYAVSLKHIKATCKCNIQSYATGCKRASIDMLDVGFGLDAWQTAMQYNWEVLCPAATFAEKRKLLD